MCYRLNYQNRAQDRTPRQSAKPMKQKTQLKTTKPQAENPFSHPKLIVTPEKPEPEVQRVFLQAKDVISPLISTLLCLLRSVVAIGDVEVNRTSPVGLEVVIRPMPICW